MSLRLEFEGLSLSDSGPVLTLSLSSRHSLSVFGPSGSGKSLFLRVCAGKDRPSRGSVTRQGKADLASFEPFPRKATPLALAQEASGKESQLAAEALGALGLWDVRKRALSELSGGQQVAAHLISTLAGSSDWLLIDGHLDLLDPWVYRDTLVLLQKRVARGAAILVATNRPEWAEMTDRIVVLRNRQNVFSGSYSELAGLGPPVEIRLETSGQEGVRALCEPLQVHVAESGGALVLRTSEGQALAARLLTEGYGDVQGMVLKPPSPRERLEALIR